MLNDLIKALVESDNEAADDVLLEALSRGNDAEKSLALHALMRRRTVHGLAGVVARYAELPADAQTLVLKNIRLFHQALRECAKSKELAARISAIRLVALGRQGKLTYLLSEALHSADETLAKTACEALVALARWVATETRRLHSARSLDSAAFIQTTADSVEQLSETQLVYRQIIDQRPEIEQGVWRALDVHRGKFGNELLRAALLLADSTQSKTLEVVQTPKHAGHGPMIRRLQQVPESEHAEAFLLGAAHGGLRGNFGVVFSHIIEPPVLDAFLRRTHWLKDQRLVLCMHQVSRGIWWNETELERDLARRDADDAACVGPWIASSGVHDVLQDTLLDKLRVQGAGHLPARLRLLDIAMRRPLGASMLLLRTLLSDPDERIARMAVREFVRRRSPDFENILIQAMANAPESVRRVIARSVGQVGFDHYWERFDRLDKSARKSAGKALFKVLPDALARLERRLRSGPVEQRIKALQITQELGVAAPLTGVLMSLCTDPHPKLRSKAVMLLAEINVVPGDVLMERVLNDPDARVRANAIEVLEAKRQPEFVPLLTERARSHNSRERANAIKALARMRVATASGQLLTMLKDERSEHRISAMWAMRQIGLWQLLREIGNIAKQDPNLRARRYALSVLRSVSDMLQQQERKNRAAG